jgi:hypothetical protein
VAADFYSDPEFLALLRFWHNSRGAAALPVWREGTVATLPPFLADKVIVSAVHDGRHRYVHVGADSARRFGANPIGRFVDETLAGPYRRYILSLIDEAAGRHAPVFSTSVYRIDDRMPVVTGRLFTPFADEASGAPSVNLAVQLFTDSELPLAAFSKGTVEEITRKLIAVPDACAKLEQASRLFRLSRGARLGAAADEMVALAREFDETATVALPTL